MSFCTEDEFLYGNLILKAPTLNFLCNEQSHRCCCTEHRALHVHQHLAVNFRISRTDRDGHSAKAFTTQLKSHSGCPQTISNGYLHPVCCGKAGKLKAGSANDTIKLEGNCDEWGTDEYNYALGLKRAKSVKDTLVAHGVSESNLKLISYGESNPTCTEKNEACWSKNRRVEFKINQ